MIPVRLPAEFAPHIVRDDCLLEDGHPLYGQDCPACSHPLGVDQLPVALVAVGIAPAARTPSGWITGAAVAVHTACARPPVDRDAVRREPFLVTVHDQITGEIKQRRVPLNNYIVIPTGSCFLESCSVWPLQPAGGTHVITIKGVRQPPTIKGVRQSPREPG